MRTLCELLLLLLSCSGLSFLFHWRMEHRPTTISGTVVDWTTGKPVPGVMVWFKELKGAGQATQTDRRGRFTAVVTTGLGLKLIFANDARSGPLLQSTFGLFVTIYKPGQQDRDVTLPVFPATQLSGHVYDEFGSPIPGCFVDALTEDLKSPTKLAAVGSTVTDQRGVFAFTGLGADRFFVLANCRKYQRPEDRSVDRGISPGLRGTRTS